MKHKRKTKETQRNTKEHQMKNKRKTIELKIRSKIINLEIEFTALTKLSYQLPQKIKLGIFLKDLLQKRLLQKHWERVLLTGYGLTRLKYIMLNKVNQKSVFQVRQKK